MADLDIQVQGLNEAINRIEGINRLLPQEASRAMVRAALIVERHMKLLLSGPAHRKFTYLDRGSSRQRIDAASRGEEFNRILPSDRQRRGKRFETTINTNPYPGTRSGHLKASVSIQYGIEGGVAIGPTAEYAKYLELGIRKMRAYPFVGPTLAQTQEAILNEFHEAVRRSIQ